MPSTLSPGRPKRAAGTPRSQSAPAAGGRARHTRGRVRVTTYEGYEGLIQLHAIPRLGQVPLPRLSPLHIQRVYGETLEPTGSLSAGTVFNLHRSVC